MFPSGVPAARGMVIKRTDLRLLFVVAAVAMAAGGEGAAGDEGSCGAWTGRRPCRNRSSSAGSAIKPVIGLAGGAVVVIVAAAVLMTGAGLLIFRGGMAGGGGGGAGAARCVTQEGVVCVVLEGVVYTDPNNTPFLLRFSL